MLKKAEELLGELNPEQQALIESATENKMPEKELLEKLGIGEDKLAEL